MMLVKFNHVFLDTPISCVFCRFSLALFFLSVGKETNRKAFSDIPIWMGETVFVLLVLLIFLCRINM